MIYRTDGSESRPLSGALPGEKGIAWTEDGGAVYVCGQGRVSLEIFRVDVETGERTLAHNIRPGDPAGVMDIQPVKITPDGRHYAYGYRRYLSDLFVVHGMTTGV
jgi:DNA-binding beta-propeller fold protein YncE